MFGFNPLSYFQSDKTPRESWDSYKEWQKNQPPQHYQQHALDLGENSSYWSNDEEFAHVGYCFGAFRCFVLTENYMSFRRLPDDKRREIVVKLLTHLLQIYDKNKGTVRRLFRGDPPAIVKLRDVIREGEPELFNYYNFEPYLYPIDVIHAHTMAQYSLSTLIMRLVCNAMRVYAPGNKNFRLVDPNVCAKAFRGRYFGQPTLFSILVVGDQQIDDRCMYCQKSSPSLWTSKGICYDCLTLKRCLCCANEAYPGRWGPEKYPRCLDHIHMDMSMDPAHKCVRG